MKSNINPVGYFEIPVTDMKRAIKFYSSVFNIEFITENIDNNQMAHFPFNESNFGISGSLVKGDIYKPSKEGSLIYFNTDDIDGVLKKVVENGYEVLYQKTSVGEYGYVAEFEDSEGNRIALTEK